MIPPSYLFKQVYDDAFELADIPEQSPTPRYRGLVTPIANAFHRLRIGLARQPRHWGKALYE